MITFPNAKINIGLYVTEKRSDGFHNLESCFYPVNWNDVLEIIPASDLSFQSTGISIPGDPSTNLCLKAYQLMKQDLALPPVAIHLHKLVPIGAGLGGGSADCAFTIKTINELFELNLSTTAQENYARQLGSDCAFFIQNKPQFCFGKGDEFADIALNLAGKYIVLINPEIHISTAEAYSGIKPKPANNDLRTALLRPMSEWKDTIFNDFETHLLPKYPIIAAVKAYLYEQGAVYACMTGSGSTVFGIFEEEPTLSDDFSNYPSWKGQLT